MSFPHMYVILIYVENYRLFKKAYFSQPFGSAPPTWKCSIARCCWQKSTLVCDVWYSFLRAREALRQCLPDQLKDSTFAQVLKDDTTTKRWLAQLVKNLQEGQVTDARGIPLAPQWRGQSVHLQLTEKDSSLTRFCIFPNVVLRLPAKWRAF